MKKMSLLVDVVHVGLLEVMANIEEPLPLALVSRGDDSPAASAYVQSTIGINLRKKNIQVTEEHYNVFTTRTVIESNCDVTYFACFEELGARVAVCMVFKGHFDLVFIKEGFPILPH